AAARLRARKRDFDVDVADDQRAVGKDRAHARRAEGVAKQCRVEDGGGGRTGGHSRLPGGRWRTVRILEPSGAGERIFRSGRWLAKKKHALARVVRCSPLRQDHDPRRIGANRLYSLMTEAQVTSWILLAASCRS